ncbi:MAG: hemolysin family protein [Oscillospiraceae bacterium]|nr:hemolysin family protein [Oscillospiraceae bacterium]
MADPGGIMPLLSFGTAGNLSFSGDLTPVTAEAVIFRIVLLLSLILVNAFFAMSEMAVVSVNNRKMERLASEGHKKARQVLTLTGNSSAFLSAIQIGVTLAGFLTSAAAAESFAPALARAACNYLPAKTPLSLVSVPALVLITLVISFFSIAFGELVPKKIALRNPEKISFHISGVMLVILKAAKPLIKIFSLTTNGALRLFGIDPDEGAKPVTEEDILILVDAGEKEGSIENECKEMIHNIFNFDDINAADVMTPIENMTAIEVSEPMGALISTAVNEGYSRIPVFEGAKDNIIGIICVKDLLKYVGADIPEGVTVMQIMRKAYYAPETKKCGGLFNEMCERRVQMAIVTDEYGAAAGLVTLEDLLESVVGNIRDEYDDDEEGVES